MRLELLVRSDLLLLQLVNQPVELLVYLCLLTPVPTLECIKRLTVLLIHLPDLSELAGVISDGGFGLFLELGNRADLLDKYVAAVLDNATGARVLLAVRAKEVEGLAMGLASDEVGFGQLWNDASSLTDNRQLGDAKLV